MKNTLQYNNRDPTKLAFIYSLYVVDQKREQWEIVTALYGVADIGKP